MLYFLTGNNYVFAMRALALSDEAIPSYLETVSAKPRAPRSDIIQQEVFVWDTESKFE
jgi:hypothetical protein